MVRSFRQNGEPLIISDVAYQRQLRRIDARDLRRQRKIDAAKAAQKTAQKAVKP
jgi:hypothetical protein